MNRIVLAWALMAVVALTSPAPAHDWGNLDGAVPPETDDLAAAIDAADRLAAIGGAATCHYWRDARGRGLGVTPALVPLLYVLPEQSYRRWAAPLRAVGRFADDDREHLSAHWSELMAALEDGTALAPLSGQDRATITADWAGLKQRLEASCD